MAGLISKRLDRYSRQIALNGFGIEGQSKISASEILVIGLGGLGSPAALYLAAAGIGVLGMADPDMVEISNLQRQILHFTPDLNRPKTDSAANKIKALNPRVKIRTFKEAAREDNISEMISGFDFIIDATDNPETKFLINDACVKEGIPYSHGGISGFNAQTMTIIPGRTACYRCLHNRPPAPKNVPDPAAVGTLGSCVGIAGAIQATEALKHIIGLGNLLTDRLLIINGANMHFRQIELARRPNCPACGKTPNLQALRK